LSPARPTDVYDTYWRFAAERQAVFFRRFEGFTPPWTGDQILSRHKFTNAYRASDRVSQYLIRHVIYGERYHDCVSEEEVFFRIILFKLFNRISTWQLLEKELGSVTFRSYKFPAFDEILSRALQQGIRIYSAAYIMPAAPRPAGERRKHRTHLWLLEKMMGDLVPAQVANCRTMQEAFDLLRSYQSVGDFLAYQFITDINYSELTNFSEADFVVPGPGARDGIRKCFLSLGGLNEVEIIKYVADHQEQEFERLGISFRSLWGRRLQLVDCQSLFCEVDKYARMAHPGVMGLSGRTRIKQLYSVSEAPLDYWYPPKWGLNQLIARERRERRASIEGLR